MSVRIRNVRKTYGGVTALRDVTLTVEPGTVHCLAGPNGSGKTTLLRIVLDLTAPSGGAVTATDGTVGAGFQDPSVFADLSVAENLDTFGAMGPAGPDWRDAVVDVLGLAAVHDRVAGDLSTGYRKKLDLALGFLARPDYLLLDEPLADLDDDSRGSVVELVRTYPDTVLVSTHHLAAFDYCDRLTVLRDGEVVLDESGANVDDPEARYRDHLPGTPSVGSG